MFALLVNVYKKEVLPVQRNFGFFRGSKA